MPNSHLKLAKHNIFFYNDLCESFSEDYFDWKITVLFYTSLHLIEALAESKSIDLGRTHRERELSINPSKSGSMPVKTHIYQKYMYLKEFSEDCRYTPYVKKKTYQKYLQKDLEKLRGFMLEIAKYVESKSNLDLEFLKAA
jgi:HEPN domain-containing protein